ncbi:DNA-binding protein YwzG [Haloferula helveola]|uniref:DNA-binding protein YwzG n=1 Tax=Haloferula helveola TaxID=490095 RepID=A0ABN6H2Y3_9BACT|nr:DNA-binding protein YwzG [Haloferula helveola]
MGGSRFSSELVRSSTDLVILALLRDRPMYGYEILVSLSDRGNGEFEFKQGTLYPLLYRLEREDWIRAKWETPASGKKRKVYSVTPEGTKVHEARVAQWHRFTQAVNSLLKDCNHE